MINLYPSGGLVAAPGNFPDWPHLHGPEPDQRKLRGHLDRLVQIPCADQKKATQLLFRFSIGTVGHEQLPAPDSYTYGRLYGVELLYRKKLSALLQRLE